MKLPSELPSRNLPNPTRAIVGQRGVDYGNASAAIAAVGRANQNSAEAMISNAQEREKKAKNQALLDAAERENRARRETMDLMYGKDDKPGLYSRQGKNAMGLEEEYAKQFSSIRQRAMAGLQDQDAINELDKALSSLDLSNLDNVKRHEQKERVGYTTQLTADKADLAAQRVYLEWNNKETFDKSLKEAEDAAITMASVQGVDATEKILSARSGVYRTRLSAMLTQDDPATVLQAHKIYKDALDHGEIHWKDVQDLDRAFSAVMPKAEAYKEFKDFQGGNNIASSQAGEIFPAMLQVETGGRHYKDGGGVITSAAGAKGIAQLMPATAKEMAKELGIDGSAWLMPEINKYLGEKYFEKMQNKFGDNVLAVLSYNWGPGNVQDHIKEVGDPRKGEVSYDYFLATVPSDEARQYVPKVLGAMGMGTGKIDVFKADQKRGTMSPEVGKEFMALVDQQNTAIAAQEKQFRQTALDDVFAFIQQNKGNGWTQMPAVLRDRAVQAGFSDRLQTYTGETTPDMASFLYSLPPKELKAFDLNAPEVRFALSPQDYDRWKQKQEKLDDPAAMVSEDTRKSIVSRAFDKRGINDRTDEGKLAKASFNELLDVQIDGFAALNNGRYPNQAEMQSLVDDMFVKRRQSVDWWFDKEVVPYQAKYEDIPKNVRMDIEEELRGRGLPVTEPMVLREYLSQFDLVMED